MSRQVAGVGLAVLAAVILDGCAHARRCRCSGSPLIDTTGSNCVDDVLISMSGSDRLDCKSELREDLRFSGQGCPCTQTINYGGRTTSQCLEKLTTREQCLAYKDGRLVKLLRFTHQEPPDGSVRIYLASTNSN